MDSSLVGRSLHRGILTWLKTLILVVFPYVDTSFWLFLILWLLVSLLVHLFGCCFFSRCSSISLSSLWLLFLLWLKFNWLVTPLWLINTIVTSLVVHLSNGHSLWLVSLLLFTFSMLVPLFSMIVWYDCLSLLCYSSLYQILSLVGNSSYIVVFVGSYVILIRLFFILWLFLIWLFFFMVILFDCFFFFLGWFIYLLVHFYFSFFSCLFFMVHLFSCHFIFGCSSICCPLLSHINGQNKWNLMKTTCIYH